MTRRHHPRRRRRRSRGGLSWVVLMPVLILAVAGAGAGIAATGARMFSAWDRHDRPGSQQAEASGSGAAAEANTPVRAGFRDISRAPRADSGPRRGSSASTGTYTVRCGRNTEGHYNSDNFIVAPGIQGGAHHLHDYVGNRSTDAYSTGRSLKAAGTTCSGGDRSTYYWPVLRVLEDTSHSGSVSSTSRPRGPEKRGTSGSRGARGGDPVDPKARAEGNVGLDGNVGRILVPTRVKIQFRGNAAGPVTAMPTFLKVVTGDAKAYTNGPKNARANWTCTGFLNRQLTDKYPRCPAGSDVVRILDFPSCWDGVNTDSANHRAHITFPGPEGVCARGTKPVPQLQIRLTYRVPQGARIALDSFPEQRHKPETDHADFANVMPAKLMKTVMACINRDRTCSG